MRYLILGASAAGVSAAKAIRRNDQRGEITVLSRDRQIYSRCLLPDVLAGRRDVAQARFVPEDFMERYCINWAGGAGALKLVPEEKEVVVDNGDRVYYDKLLIATGASSILPMVENIGRGRQVFGLRNIEDVLNISMTARECCRAVVMGGGLVGLDAAVALYEKGCTVTIVEMAGRILPLQLDQMAAARYEALFQDRGIEIITGELITRIMLDDQCNVTGVKLKSGRVMPCCLVVVAAGVKPNISFLEGNAVTVGHGIKVNEYQETSCPDIYAAGDVCESLDVFTGKISPTPIWPLAVLQGQAAGRNMAGGYKKIVKNFAYQNAMRFFGLSTVSIGFSEAPDETYDTYIEERQSGYKKIILKDGCLRGAVLQGDIAKAGVFASLILNKIPPGVPTPEFFGLSYARYFNQRENGEFVYAQG